MNYYFSSKRHDNYIKHIKIRHEIRFKLSVTTRCLWIFWTVTLGNSENVLSIGKWVYRLDSSTNIDCILVMFIY
jgi:hypothetical protein